MIRRTKTVIVMCMLCAIAALLLSTTCSPLFTMSFWTDTNIYFTMGKGIRHGLLPYRDLYDHKGPLLYFLYYLCAVISENSFIGVFVIEVLSLGGVCYISYRINERYHKGVVTTIAIPLTAIIMVSCVAFNQGGSAEELCLPALVLAIYSFFGLFESDSKPFLTYLFGVTAGYIFWIKYTICGLHIGLGIATVFYLIWKYNIRTACIHVSKWALGFLFITLPIIIMMYFSGILFSCVQAYFIDNLTVYEGTPLTATGHLYNALAYLRTQSAANPVVFLFTVMGFLYIIYQSFIDGRLWTICLAAGYPIAAGIFLLFVYWGEMAHPYYALVFVSLACIGCMPVIKTLYWISGKIKRKHIIPLCIVFICILIIPITYFTSKVRPLLNVKQADMPQYQFADIILKDDNISLLDVTSLDQGFYFAAGILPTCRYFADNNLPSTEKETEIKRYLAEGIPKYVVSIYRVPGDKYELMAEAEGLFDLAVIRHYKLYRLRQ